MEQNKKISIKEIAKLSGVSVATVSRVLNNNGRFSEETKKKVLATVDKYGYTTNMAAKSLRVSKSNTVGLIVPSINNPWFSQLVLEIEKIFFELNYSVFICNTSQIEEKEILYFKSLDAKLVDGIICISGIEEIPSNVITRDIPIICIDRQPRNSHNTYYVESNHYNGGYLATEELIRQGCNRIAIISRSNSLSYNNERYQGYKKALTDYCVPEYEELHFLIGEKEDNYEGAKRIIKEMLDKGIEFDGVFATNDWRAYGALVALQEASLNVPKDVKIMGFDDIFISRTSHPTLSTIKQDIPGMAEKTCHLLYDLMNNNNVDEQRKRYVLPVELVRRESTAKD